MKVYKIISRIGIVIILLLAILSGSIMLDVYKNNRNDPSSLVDQDSDIFIDKNTLIRQEIFYTLSKRVVSTTKGADQELYGKSLAQLEELGWNAFRSSGGQIILFKEVEALSPEDEEKCHLKVHNGKLAIYAGPSTAQGPLLNDLGINPDYLDESWQSLLEQGGIDFANLDELFMALESLDEY